MVDATSIIEGGGEFSLGNILFFLVTGIGSLFLVVFGANSGNISMLALGSVFLFATLVGATGMTVGGSYFKSPATLGQIGLAYWTPILLLNSGQITSLLPLSFAVPSQSYASSAIAGVSTAVVSMVNGFLAPHAESFAIGGAAVLLVAGLQQIIDNRVLAVGVAVFTLSVVFGQLHGLRRINFLVSAIIFMFITLGLLTFTDIGVDIPLAQSLIVTWGLFVGIHVGWNRAASGLGVTGFYQSILTAGPPINNFAFLIIGLEFLLAVVALLEVFGIIERTVLG